MALEYKGLRTTGEDAAALTGVIGHDDSGGTITALVAISGVRDRVGDLIVPGALGRSLKRVKPKGCIGHDWTRRVSKVVDIEELLPGDPRLPQQTATGAPWPKQAGGLMVKAKYNLDKQDGCDAYSDAKFYEKDENFSIGYKVVPHRTKKVRAGRDIHDLDVYEYSQVLHGAHELASLTGVKSLLATTQTPDEWYAGQRSGIDHPEGACLPYGVEIKATIRTVKDPEYWGLPFGTPIRAHMRPRGPKALAERAQGKVPSAQRGTDTPEQEQDALLPEEGARRVKPRVRDEWAEGSTDPAAELAGLIHEAPDAKRGRKPGIDQAEVDRVLAEVLDDALTPQEFEEELRGALRPDVDERDVESVLDDYRTMYQERRGEQERTGKAGVNPDVRRRASDIATEAIYDQARDKLVSSLRALEDDSPRSTADWILSTPLSAQAGQVRLGAALAALEKGEPPPRKDADLDDGALGTLHAALAESRDDEDEDSPEYEVLDALAGQVDGMRGEKPAVAPASGDQAAPEKPSGPDEALANIRTALAKVKPSDSYASNTRKTLELFLADGADVRASPDGRFAAVNNGKTWITIDTRSGAGRPGFPPSTPPDKVDAELAKRAEVAAAKQQQSPGYATPQPSERAKPEPEKSASQRGGQRTAEQAQFVRTLQSRLHTGDSAKATLAALRRLDAGSDRAMGTALDVAGSMLSNPTRKSVTEQADEFARLRGTVADAPSDDEVRAITARLDDIAGALDAVGNGTRVPIRSTKPSDRPTLAVYIRDYAAAMRDRLDAAQEPEGPSERAEPEKPAEAVITPREQQRAAATTEAPGKPEASAAATLADGRETGAPEFVNTHGIESGDYPTITAGQARVGDHVMFNRHDGGEVLAVEPGRPGQVKITYQGVNNQPSTRSKKTDTRLPVLRTAQQPDTRQTAPDASQREEPTPEVTPTAPEVETPASTAGQSLGERIASFYATQHSAGSVIKSVKRAQGAGADVPEGVELYRVTFSKGSRNFTTWMALAGNHLVAKGSKRDDVTYEINWLKQKAPHQLDPNRKLDSDLPADIRAEIESEAPAAPEPVAPQPGPNEVRQARRDAEDAISDQDRDALADALTRMGVGTGDDDRDPDRVAGQLLAIDEEMRQQRLDRMEQAATMVVDEAPEKPAVEEEAPAEAGYTEAGYTAPATPDELIARLRVLAKNADSRTRSRAEAQLGMIDPAQGGKLGALELGSNPGNGLYAVDFGSNRGGWSIMHAGTAMPAGLAEPIKDLTNKHRRKSTRSPGLTSRKRARLFLDAIANNLKDSNGNPPPFGTESAGRELLEWRDVDGLSARQAAGYKAVPAYLDEIGFPEDAEEYRRAFAGHASQRERDTSSAETAPEPEKPAEEIITPAEQADAEALRGDALGLVEAEDGELEVTEEVAQRQDRVEALIESGGADLGARFDDELGGVRVDLVDELALQDEIRRRDAQRRQERRVARTEQAAREDGASGATEPAPDVPTPAVEEGPKVRPGLAGAVEDLSDLLNERGVKADDPDARAAADRLTTVLRRNKATEGAVADLRTLIGDDVHAAIKGGRLKPGQLYTLAAALRQEARARRNAAGRARRLARRIERERLRSLLGQVDGLLRGRGRDPEQYGGPVPAAPTPERERQAAAQKTAAEPKSAALESDTSEPGRSLDPKDFRAIRRLGAGSRYFTQYEVALPDGTTEEVNHVGPERNFALIVDEGPEKPRGERYFVKFFEDRNAAEQRYQRFNGQPHVIVPVEQGEDRGKRKNAGVLGGGVAEPDMGDLAQHQRPADLVAEDQAIGDRTARAIKLIREARQASEDGDHARAVDLIEQAQAADPPHADRMTEMRDRFAALRDEQTARIVHDSGRPTLSDEYLDARAVAEGAIEGRDQLALVRAIRAMIVGENGAEVDEEDFEDPVNLARRLIRLDNPERAGRELDRFGQTLDRAAGFDEAPSPQPEEAPSPQPDMTIKRGRFHDQTAEDFPPGTPVRVFGAQDSNHEHPEHAREGTAVRRARNGYVTVRDPAGTTVDVFPHQLERAHTTAGEEETATDRNGPVSVQVSGPAPGDTGIPDEKAARYQASFASMERLNGQRDSALVALRRRNNNHRNTRNQLATIERAIAIKREEEAARSAPGDTGEPVPEPPATPEITPDQLQRGTLKRLGISVGDRIAYMPDARHEQTTGGRVVTGTVRKGRYDGYDLDGDDGQRYPIGGSATVVRAAKVDELGAQPAQRETPPESEATPTEPESPGTETPAARAVQPPGTSRGRTLALNAVVHAAGGGGGAGTRKTKTGTIHNIHGPSDGSDPAPVLDAVRGLGWPGVEIRDVGPSISGSDTHRSRRFEVIVPGPVDEQRARTEVQQPEPEREETPEPARAEGEPATTDRHRQADRLVLDIRQAIRDKRYNRADSLLEQGRAVEPENPRWDRLTVATRAGRKKNEVRKTAVAEAAATSEPVEPETPATARAVKRPGRDGATEYVITLPDGTEKKISVGRDYSHVRVVDLGDQGYLTTLHSDEESASAKHPLHRKAPVTAVRIDDERTSAPQGAQSAPTEGDGDGQRTTAPDSGALPPAPAGEVRGDDAGRLPGTGGRSPERDRTDRGRADRDDRPEPARPAADRAVPGGETESRRDRAPRDTDRPERTGDQAGQRGPDTDRPDRGTGDSGGRDTERGTGGVRDSEAGAGPDTARPADAGEPAEVVTGADQPDADPGQIDAIPGTGPSFRPRGIDDLAPAGEKAKLDSNMAALRVLRVLQRDNRAATPEEQTILARWAGWGGLPDVFDETKSKYGDERDELKELLTPAEYNEARRNTLNAHYTDARAVQAMWQAVQDLGFDGGRVLEPGSGSGNFIGFAPESARMTGVELDSTTAAISHALYPDAEIRNESFAKTRLPDGVFDAAVGNVPFGRFALTDKRHNRDGESIHNHFILKSLALTRPGGLVAVLTSRYTMDSERSAARKKMAEMGDLVGAVRLPTGSHQRASGTNVIEDILILRRREPGAEPIGDQSWITASKKDLDGWEIPVNDYWDAHPDHILGEMTGVKGQFGGDIKVTGDKGMADLPTVLSKITHAALATGLGARGRDPDAHEAEFAAPNAMYEGGIAVGADGEFTQNVGGVMVPFDVPDSQAEELRGLIGLRDTFTELLDAEAATDRDTPEIQELRQRLNDQYDAHVARYKPINYYELTKAGARKPNPQGGFLRDPRSAIVRSLERYDPDSGTATKAAIFRQRVAAPRQLQESADNPVDALALSMDALGRVDLPMIARLLNTDEDDARDQLGDLVHEQPPLSDTEADAAFQADAIQMAGQFGGVDVAPEADLSTIGESVRQPGALVPAAEYLSGNVRRKLAAAKAAAEHDPRFKTNVDALQQVIPADLTPQEIEGRLGAAWIGADDVKAFTDDLLDVPGYLRTDRVRSTTVSTSGGGIWVVDAPDGGVIGRETWGTADRSAGDLIQAMLEQRPIKITRTVEGPDGKKKQVPDLEATLAAQAKAEAIAERFSEWLWEDPDRSRRLQARYNMAFNAIRLRSYDGDHRELPGKAKAIDLWPHQHAAVSRIVHEPAVLLAHVVGSGKTMEMAAGAMELKRLGMATKPVIVIPNHMKEQFDTEFRQLYPRANILAAGSEDLEGPKRREFVGRVAAEDYDCVILTQKAFEAIPMSPKQQQAYIDREMADMRRQLEEAQAAAEASGDGTAATTVKRMERAVLSAEQALEKKLETGLKDVGGVTFEQTGIDYIFVDEAHHFSNLRTISNIQGAGATGSGMATDLHMKIEYLRENNASNRVVTFASGTPIRNTVTQAYIMMRYLRPDLLKQAGINSFDTWAATFGKIIEEMELKPEGSGFRQSARFAKFQNVPELLQIFHVFTDVKMAEDLDLPTPELAGGKVENVVVPRTAQLAEFIKGLGQRAGEVRDGSPRKFIRVDEKTGAEREIEDNMLLVSMDGRKGALDMRLVGGTPEAGKIDAAADRIRSIWDENKDRRYPLDPKNPDMGDDPTPGALQIVFLDMGTPGDGKKKSGDWNAYDDLKAKLVARGMDPKSIRYMHEAKNDREKAELFAAARSGKISVLVGSTEKMGVGTNVQARAIALHHLDAPWRPSDVEQRDGRIMRQGNAHQQMGIPVQIIRYVTEGSFDSYMWQTLTRKSKFINQILRGDLNVREIEDIGANSLDYAEVMALSTGNPDLMDKAKVDTLLGKLTRLQRTHERTQANLRRDAQLYAAKISQSETDADALDEAITRRVDTSGDKFVATVGGARHAKRSEANTALNGALWDVLRGWQRGPVKVGALGGFDLMAERVRAKRGGGEELALTLDGVPGEVVTYGAKDLRDGRTDTIARVEYFIGNAMPITRDRLRGTAERLRDELPRIQDRIGITFGRTEELKAAQAKSERLRAKMMLDIRRLELPPGAEPIPFDPFIDSARYDSPLVGGGTAADAPPDPDGEIERAEWERMWEMRRAQADAERTQRDAAPVRPGDPDAALERARLGYAGRRTLDSGAESRLEQLINAPRDAVHASPDGKLAAIPNAYREDEWQVMDSKTGFLLMPPGIDTSAVPDIDALLRELADVEPLPWGDQTAQRGQLRDEEKRRETADAVKAIWLRHIPASKHPGDPQEAQRRAEAAIAAEPFGHPGASVLEAISEANPRHLIATPDGSVAAVQIRPPDAAYRWQRQWVIARTDTGEVLRRFKIDENPADLDAEVRAFLPAAEEKSLIQVEATITPIDTLRAQRLRSEIERMEATTGLRGFA